jgi:UDP-N-acetyl-D-glucosamine/UDP-N-acetyl-D-galactosamine dehydrogenase
VPAVAVCVATELDMISLRKCRTGVMGLGYVGLAPAVEFGELFETIGFAINVARIKALRAGRHRTREVTVARLSP